MATGAFVSAQSVIRLPVTRSTGNSFVKRDATTPLYNDIGIQYLVTVSAGTPSQNFTVSLDTGSSDLWFAGNGCPTTSCPVPQYNAASSSSVNQTQNPLRLKYGLGSANGTYVQDTVALAGVSIPKQQFGVMNQVTDIFVQNGSGVGGGKVKSSGILGLAFDGLITASGRPNYPTVINSLISENLISQPIFSIYLNFMNATGWTGEMILGGIDSTKYTGQLSYASVGSYNLQGTTSSTAGSGAGTYLYWSLAAQSFDIVSNGVNYGGQLTKQQVTVIDTGSTLSYLPTPAVQAIVKAFGQYVNPTPDISGVYVLKSCTVPDDVVDIKVQFLADGAASNSTAPTGGNSTSGSASLHVRASDLVQNAGNGQCFLGIQDAGTSGSNLFDMLLGDSFLRGSYMVFDVGQKRVGFAPATASAGSANGSGSGTGSGASGPGGVSSAATKVTKSSAMLLASWILMYHNN
ncbi:aspartic peptidase domain-containing protein [Gongronella butleri]|nr:aspartic peptidase domain-containing protein [Gongronella butleri]